MRTETLSAIRNAIDATRDRIGHLAKVEGQVDSLQKSALPMMQDAIKSTGSEVKQLAEKVEKKVEPIERIQLGVWAVGIVLLLFGTTFGALLPYLYAKITYLADKTAELEKPIKEWDEKIAKSEKRFDDHVEVRKGEFMKSTRLEILKSLPIGTILAYQPPVGQDLPDGWMYCNDSEVTDELSPFFGKKVPNLNGHMLRGGINGETIGESYGSDKLPNHSHQVPQHHLSLEGLTTSWISDQRGSGDIPKVTVLKHDGAFGPGHLVWKGESEIDGQHTHALHGNIKHDAINTGPVIGNDNLDFLPKYVAVRFIIRIR
ncbi:MAG: hypothetical protein KDA88_14090 [Planctomycetaceae bacterium]|nr:hypothetical protein [Planctomycetaceae bacterium]